jgi:hypothetical protein
MFLSRSRKIAMRYFPILAVGWLIAMPTATAEMLPAYDPLEICSYVAGTSARQELIMRGCLDFQERTRKEVSLVWDKLPQPVQESCSNAAKASGDYWKLKSCIDREVEAASDR